MRLLRFEDGGRAAAGVRIGDAVVPLAALEGVPDDPVAILAGGAALQAKVAAAASASTARRPLAGLKLLMPIARPGKVICIGLNYALHAKEGGNPIPDYPAVFLRVQSSLVGPDAPMLRPGCSTKFDYEAELAVVIGRTARRVKKADAYDFVGGYTVANDYAIRDYLENWYRPNLRVKNRDTCTPIGPWLVDAADIANPMALALQTTVNGQVTQSGNTADMIFDVPTLIEYFSSFMTLNPGDLILTGTPDGIVNVNPGDVVVTEIDNIGALTNTLVKATP